MQGWITSDVKHAHGRPMCWLSERYFFRDPVRASHADSGYSFSPAEGAILYRRTLAATDALVEIKGCSYTLRERMRNPAFDARIFITLYDVQVNRGAVRRHPWLPTAVADRHL